MAEIKIIITGVNEDEIKMLAEDAVSDINSMDGDHVASLHKPTPLITNNTVVKFSGSVSVSAEIMADGYGFKSDEFLKKLEALCKEYDREYSLIYDFNSK